MASRVDAVTVEQVNTYFDKHRGMAVARKVCAMEAVTNDGVVSSDLVTQRQINETLTEYPHSFSDVIKPSQSQTFQVRVVYLSDCDDATVTSPALLITRSGVLHSMMVQESPFTRIYKRDDGKLNVFSCYECGDFSELSYDVGRDRFYLEYIGH